ncbi:hypothetical protein H101_01427 [Trichophyton interdigitale H6]|nr:hypothetical protein H101_01427 [Trichophyton interdigitale H6]
MGLSTPCSLEIEEYRQTERQDDGHAEVCELGMGELPRDLRTGAQATGQCMFLSLSWRACAACSSDIEWPGGLRITAARPGTVHFELDVQKEHTNRLGILHGGTIASMVDLGGSLAVASHGLFATGVSTDLNVTYLGSGGKVGDKILAEVTCDKCKFPLWEKCFLRILTMAAVGNKLAYTTIKFTNKADEIVARGSHTKYIAQAFRDPRNIIEQKKS